MKIKLLVFIVLISVSGAFSQKNVLSILNGNFESGTVQLWRALEVRSGSFWWLSAGDALSTVKISENSHNGNYAAEFTWEIDDNMGDIIFDVSPMILAETGYTFKAWAMSLDGPCMLRLHCTYITPYGGTVVGDYFDETWILTDTYEEHTWEIPPAPEGVGFAQIGFRVFNVNGSRWPETAITTLIDDVSLWRDSRETDGVEYTLITSSVGDGEGIVQLVPAGGIYCEGTEVIATVKHNICNEFVSWSGDTSGTNESISIVMNGNKTIVADLAIAENGVEYELISNLIGSGGGIIELDPSGGIYCEGTSVTVTVIPDANSKFLSWSGDASGTNETITILMDGDKNLTADVSVKYVLTTSLIGSGDGSIELDPSGGEYAEGTSVAITVIPNNRSYFIEWSGDTSGTEETITIVMDGDKTIIADLGVKYRLTSSLIGLGNGIIELDPSGGMYPEGTSVIATVKPDVNCNFIEWSGDASGTEETATIIMDEDKTIVANIEIIDGVEGIINTSSKFISYPNPFNFSTTLKYTLSEKTNVKLSIYSLTGKLINVLVNQNQNSGDYTIIWNGTDLLGTRLSEGIYFGRLDILDGKAQNIKIFKNK